MHQRELPEAETAAAELRVWKCMQDVRELAGKLYGNLGELGDDVYTAEVRRWCPDPSALKHQETVSGNPEIIEYITDSGLLGDHSAIQDRVVEYLPSDICSNASDSFRREMFSFAVARTLDIPDQELQMLLAMTNTKNRLNKLEEVLCSGRNYLAARSTLWDAFH